MGLGTKIFGTYSDRQIKKLEKIANQIEALADKYSAMTAYEMKRGAGCGAGASNISRILRYLGLAENYIDT